MCGFYYVVDDTDLRNKIWIIRRHSHLRSGVSVGCVGELVAELPLISPAPSVCVSVLEASVSLSPSEPLRCVRRLCGEGTLVVAALVSSDDGGISGSAPLWLSMATGVGVPSLVVGVWLQAASAVPDLGPLVLLAEVVAGARHIVCGC